MIKLKEVKATILSTCPPKLMRIAYPLHTYLSTLTRMVGDHLSQRYCEVLLKLSQEGDIGNNTSWNLILVRSLWSRIMAALPASVQKATILSSSLSNLVHVCICMDLHCLHPDLLKEVLARVLPDCLNILTTSDSSTEFVSVSVDKYYM